MRLGRAHHERRVVARGYELALLRAERPSGSLSAVVPLRAAELLACRPLVRQVVEQLRDEGREIEPGAVHRARRLLSTPSGPLRSAGDLEAELRAVRDALAAPCPWRSA